MDTMNAKRSGWLGVVAMAVLAAALAGCKNNRGRQERDALFTQNNELQGELNRTRSALDAAESERAAWDAERARIQAELDAERARAAAVPPPQPTPSGGTGPTGGFGGIEDTEVFRGQGTITVRMPGDVLFSPGKADLSAQARRSLDQIAQVINREYPDAPIRVEGHTDTDPIRKSKWASNDALSEARAQAVERYLRQKGVDASRLQTVGHGASKPLDTKARSRRVEIVVLTSR
jgi:chemotaxis protein MotB